MIWKIAKKEFLLNMMTFKIAVGTIVCMVLTAVFVPVLAKDYQERLRDYDTSVAANEAKLSKVKVYKNIMPTVYRRPSVLSVFTEGLEKQLGKSAKVELGGVPEIMTASGTGNPFLSAFPTLDVMLILKVVISVLALLVAYDTISGEREQGTLRLMLSVAAARHQVLLGKLLAGLLTLIIPVTTVFILGLLILQFFPMVSLAGADWTRIGIMYLVSLIFISTMYNVGLLFSCLMRRSSISLVLGLFGWILFVIVIPNASVYLAHYLWPAKGRKKIDAQVKALMEERDNKIADLTKAFSTSGNQSGGRGPGGSFIYYCDERLLANYPKRYALSEPVRITYADRIFEVQQQYLRGLTKQKYLASAIAQISPVTIYENVMSALAGTDFGSHEHFRNQVKTHTNTLVEYIHSETENFSSLSYFTPTKKEDHAKAMKETVLWIVQTRERVTDTSLLLKELQKWQEQMVRQIPSLDLQGLPRFTCGHENLARTLHRAVPQMMLLIFINALLFTLSFVAFLRYDVRLN